MLYKDAYDLLVKEIRELISKGESVEKIQYTLDRIDYELGEKLSCYSTN